MRVPLSWLNDYVKIDDIDPKLLAEKLTRAGLQVEEIVSVGEEALSDLIVVAEVLECEAHPDSDHLHVCKVTDGHETYQVVCGAPNMRKGIKTAFAKIGALIPEGGFKIKKGKLRGVESFGMCCSERELHIGAGEAGIIEYPAETPVGALVREVAALPKPEIVFEIEVTWNRPDALSVYGIAREYAAILGRELKLPAVDFVESATKVEDEVKVSVLDAEKCPRYTARVVTALEDGPSPELIARRLELCGVSAHSLSIDVTNYVMFELGQPQHAFDYTCLKHREVVVRTAKAGECITTLDGVERKLDESMLMICDAERPNCVAGVMGGVSSGVGSATHSLLLESALFEPVSVKNTATKLNLASESAYRYIRGVDWDLADFASRRTMHLLQRYGKAVIAAGVIDIDHRPQPFNPDVALSFDRARRLIGMELSGERMTELLVSLGLKVVSTDAQGAVFGIPSWRRDLSLEADLVEEIARLNGLDNLPDVAPSAPAVSALDESGFRAQAQLRRICLALGFTESCGYSFLSKKELDDVNPEDEGSRLYIPDPVSAEYGVMRPSLLPQMIASLGRNATRQVERAMLFELGKVYASVQGGDGVRRPTEKAMLSLGMLGAVGREPLRRRSAVTEEEAVLWMKGAVEALIKRLKAGKLEFESAAYPAFAEGAALTVKLNGRKLGIMGALSAKGRHPYRLTTQMALCELELKPLLKHVFDVPRVSAPPAFPAVRRDVAVVCKPGVSNATIDAAIRKSGGDKLTKVELFDVFGDSRAYALEFRSAEKTLTDEEVGESFNRIVTALKGLEGVEVREG